MYSCVWTDGDRSGDTHLEIELQIHIWRRYISGGGTYLEVRAGGTDLEVQIWRYRSGWTDRQIGSRLIPSLAPHLHEFSADSRHADLIMSIADYRVDLFIRDGMRRRVSGGGTCRAVLPVGAAGPREHRAPLEPLLDRKHPIGTLWSSSPSARNRLEVSCTEEAAAARVAVLAERVARGRGERRHQAHQHAVAAATLARNHVEAVPAARKAVAC